MTDVAAVLRDALAGRYVIDREIGRGGMASVYLARDVRHGRSVAVKVLHPEIAAAIGAERFLREIQVAARLRHPHILPLFDSGEASDPHDSAGGRVLFYVMPYVAGESLRDRLRRDGALPVSDALRIAREVADALDYAHREGVIHRDIKPDNILLDDRHALITDFGIARAVTQENTTQTLTSTGILIGTPAYMSPEQVGGDATLDGRSDIYALGCVLYEMLAGEPPFAGGSVQAVMTKRLAVAAPQIPENFPAAAASIVTTSMQLAPDARYRSAREMADALDAVSTSGADLIAPVPVVPKPTARRWVTIGAMSVAVLAASVMLWSKRASDSRAATDSARAADAVPAIGVLPFANRSDSRDMEFFSAAITDELITELSRVQGIHVAGRSSSFSLKGKGLDARQSAETLHVKFLVDGSVRNAAGRVIVNWDLIDGANGQILNSRRFEDEIRNLTALQDSLIQTIVAQLRQTLGTAVTASASRRRTPNSEAQLLYMKGHYYWNQRTPATMSRGIDYLKQAIAKDSDYALAWAELSSAYTLEPGFGDMAPAQVRDVARAAAEHAVRLDSTLAEGYTALGTWSTFADQDWRQALTYMDKAVALDSTSSSQHLFRAWPLVALGRTEDALVEVAKAVKLDRLAPTENARFGTTLVYLRRYDEAIAHLRKALDLDPSNTQARFDLGRALSLKGQYDEALKYFPDGIEVQAGLATGAKAAALGLAGRRTEARALYEQLVALSKKRPVTLEALAQSALGAGDKQLALDWLERGVREHSFYLAFVNADPLYDPLRTEPRFQALMRQLQFPNSK
ncbi:MAG TPA: protein kinase [Gemmatimonadaceae bacterium]|nr:protein kinase [Gemmatimonadaceae bacterium]